MNVDYLIKDGNGSGHPGEPRPFRPEYETDQRDEHFIIARDDLSREPLKIGGVRLSRRAYGFGPFILKRKSPVSN